MSIKRNILSYKDFKKDKDSLENPKKHPIKESDDTNDIVTINNFKNHVLPDHKEALFRGIPDNRSEAKEGDIALGVWFPNETWFAFKIEKLNTKGEPSMGLGFASSKGVGTDNSIYDIGDAFHIIVLK